MHVAVAEDVQDPHGESHTAVAGDNQPVQLVERRGVAHRREVRWRNRTGGGLAVSGRGG
jgi:hypothetical protein